MPLALFVAGLVSIYYHWAQLHYGPQRDEVRKILLLDYGTAILAIGTSLSTLGSLIFSCITLGVPLPPALTACVTFSALACASLYVSWLKEEGDHYLVWHGLWHVFGGIGAYYLTDAMTQIFV